MSSKVHILGFTGSLREESYNRAALRAAQELLPANTTLEIFSIGELPPYDQQYEQGEPEVVRTFKEKLQQADALLIVTPEYNGLLSRTLKNALNWAGSALADKPTAIMGVGRPTGTERELASLRQELSRLHAQVLDESVVYVTSGWEKFDSEGRLTDDATRQQMRALLEAVALHAHIPALVR